jgi:hypothetical protein
MCCGTMTLAPIQGDKTVTIEIIAKTGRESNFTAEISRIRVPGGWLYRDYIIGHGGAAICHTFVPDAELPRPNDPLWEFRR